MLQKKVQLHTENHQEESIDKLIKTNPLLLDKYDKSVIRVGEYYLPYSTGFEIECSMKPKVILEDVKNITELISYDVNTYSEQRFRIPSGIVGLQALQKVSMFMLENGLFNDQSGIHYHVDFTDTFEDITSEFVEENEQFILEELDTWEYKGMYNKKHVHIDGGGIWVRFQTHFKTMEIRIGEMTFDYDLLFKRITHANQIARALKQNAKMDVISRYKSNYEDDLKNRVIKI